MYLKIQITNENGDTLNTIELSQDNDSDAHAAYEIESLLLKEYTESFQDREPARKDGVYWLAGMCNMKGAQVCIDWEGFEWIEETPDSDEWRLTGERLSFDHICDLIND